ncbi:hypothetical protein ACOMHN_023919 [Nucella lapillus]
MDAPQTSGGEALPPPAFEMSVVLPLLKRLASSTTDENTAICLKNPEFLELASLFHGITTAEVRWMSRLALEMLDGVDSEFLEQPSLFHRITTTEVRGMSRLASELLDGNRSFHEISHLSGYFEFGRVYRLIDMCKSTMLPRPKTTDNASTEQPSKIAPATVATETSHNSDDAERPRDGEDPDAPPQLSDTDDLPQGWTGVEVSEDDPTKPEASDAVLSAAKLSRHDTTAASAASVDLDRKESSDSDAPQDPGGESPSEKASHVDEELIIEQEEDSALDACGSTQAATRQSPAPQDAQESVTGEENSPPVTGEENSPLVTDEENSPLVTGENSPLVTGEENSPLVTGEENSPPVTGEENSPPSELAMEATLQDPDGQRTVWDKDSETVVTPPGPVSLDNLPNCAVPASASERVDAAVKKGSCVVEQENSPAFDLLQETMTSDSKSEESSDEGKSMDADARGESLITDTASKADSSEAATEPGLSDSTESNEVISDDFKETEAVASDEEAADEIPEDCTGADSVRPDDATKDEVVPDDSEDAEGAAHDALGESDEIPDDATETKERSDDLPVTEKIERSDDLPVTEKISGDCTETVQLAPRLPENHLKRNAQVKEIPSELSPFALPFMPREPPAAVSQTSSSLPFEDYVVYAGDIYVPPVMSSLEGSRFGPFFQRTKFFAVPPNGGPVITLSSIQPIEHGRLESPGRCEEEEEEEEQLLKECYSNGSTVLGRPKADPGHTHGISLSDERGNAWGGSSSASRTDSVSLTDASEGSGDQSRARRSPDLGGVGSDSSSSDFTDISDAADLANRFYEGDTTLLAKSKPDDQNIFGVPYKWASSDCKVWAPTEKDRQQGFQQTRLSADSGLASLSDLFSETPRDSEGGKTVHLCSQHDQPLIMYCKENYEMLCHVCALHHPRCERDVNLSLACSDVKFKLLRAQKHIDGHIRSLTDQSDKLKPELNKVVKRRDEAKVAAVGIFRDLIRTISEEYERQMTQLEESFAAIERRLSQKINKSQLTLNLLNSTSHFLQLLRRQDNGLDLLSAFDAHLARLLEQVLQTSESSQSKLIDLREVAYSSFKAFAHRECAEGLENWSKEEFMSKLNADDAASAEDWLVNDKVSQSVSDVETVMREFKEYLHERSSGLTLNSRPSSSMLYSVVEGIKAITPPEFFDDVFLYEAKPNDSPADVFTRQATPKYERKQQVAVTFSEDSQPAFVTDLHFTDTQFLVFLDAANNSLKRHHLHPAARATKRSCLKVPQPLAMCSGGWDRVMVSCAGRQLKVYEVGLQQQMKLVMQRSTQYQYRGLARVSEALVAAACPETGSVHLLDLSGNVQRDLRPVVFRTA